MTGRRLCRASAALALGLCWGTAFAQTVQDPPVPVGVAPDGVVVALCDTGVNYTLPLIAERLSRDGEGDLIGYDFQDDDLTPMDHLPGDERASPRRHGTLIASAILHEAPNALIAPYRYRHGNTASFAMMLGHAGLTPARIVAMSPVGGRREDWQLFAQAARAHPNLLIIASAGTGNRDIDTSPIYPAALELDNLLVVTASDAQGRRVPGANFGRKSVHFAVPVVNVVATDFSGRSVTVSGPGFAVARAVALAARILFAAPDLDTAALKQRILSHARETEHAQAAPTRFGWIANPAAIAPAP